MVYAASSLLAVLTASLLVFSPAAVPVVGSSWEEEEDKTHGETFPSLRGFQNEPMTMMQERRLGANGQPCGFQVFEDVDLPGSDFSTPVPLGSFPFPKGVFICSEICRAIPYCRSFSLVDVGKFFIYNPWPLCFLKDPVPSGSRSDGITSGVRIAQDDGCKKQPGKKNSTSRRTPLLWEGTFFSLALPCLKQTNSMMPLNNAQKFAQ